MISEPAQLWLAAQQRRCQACRNSKMAQEIGQPAVQTPAERASRSRSRAGASFRGVFFCRWVGGWLDGPGLHLRLPVGYAAQQGRGGQVRIRKTGRRPVLDVQVLRVCLCFTGRTNALLSSIPHETFVEGWNVWGPSALHAVDRWGQKRINRRRRTELTGDEATPGLQKAPTRCWGRQRRYGRWKGR